VFQFFSVNGYRIFNHEEHEEKEFADLSNRVIGWAIKVLRELGPSLLETAYEQWGP